jgi:hypothetical protein
MDPATAPGHTEQSKKERQQEKETDPSEISASP